MLHFTSKHLAYTGFIVFLVSNPLYSQSMTPAIEKKIEQMESSIQTTEKALVKMRASQVSTNVLLKKTQRELAITRLELKKNKPIEQAKIVKKFSSYAHVEAAQDGFGIVSNDQKNKLFMHGLYQVDQDIFFDTRGLTINNGVSSTPITNQNTVDRFWIRRARPIFSGTLLEKNHFLFVPDFGQGQMRLYDSIIDLRYFKLLSLRAGKQLSLVSGMDNLINPGTLLTMEHGYTSILAPNREIGFVFYGSLGDHRQGGGGTKDYKYIAFDDWLSYEVGLLSGTFDNTNPGLNPVSATTFNSEVASLANKSFEARVFANPFLSTQWDYIKNLGIGFSGSTESVNNQNNLPAIISVGQNSIFTYTATVNGNGSRTRLHPQAFWFLGAFGIIGEWTQTLQKLTNGPESLNVNPTSVVQKNTAKQIQVVYNLTQEPLLYGVLTPNRNFNPGEKGAYGAFQLVVRFTGLTMDNSIFNSYQLMDGQTTYTFADPRLSIQTANTWTVGLNWFWSRAIRLSTEYNQTSFIGGCSTGGMQAPITPGCLTAGAYATASTSTVLNRPDEKIVMQRLQLFF